MLYFYLNIAILNGKKQSKVTTHEKTVGLEE